MNYLKSGALCVLLTVAVMSSKAQEAPALKEPDYNKPKLFADLPQKITLDLTPIAPLLDAPVGEQVNVHLGGNFNYRGTIISKSDPSDAAVKSIVIKATNRLGAILTLTQVRNADGGVSYIGRILSRDHSDAYDIRFEEGKYVLAKKHLYDLINE